jgi:hypothetical protein
MRIMVKPITLLVALLLATPAIAQSRVWSNADLGRPLSPDRGTVTAEQLASLEAHQFQLPVRAEGPYVVGLTSSSTDGPFGAFPAYSPPAPIVTVYGEGSYGYGLGYGYGTVVSGFSRTAGRVHGRPAMRRPPIAVPPPIAPSRVIPTPHPAGSLGIRVPRP